ncbi:MAG: hypothetical protein QG646_742 [Euryarchaeota archaeon]|nr:hypothetical protein [Euryarchaeota archaeon]
MELHPFLAKLDKKDLERYMNACKDDLWDFLDNFGLSDALVLQVLEDVRSSILKNETFLFLRPSDINDSREGSKLEVK